MIRSGALDPVESGGTAEVESFETTFSDFSTLATLVEQTTGGVERPVDRGGRHHRRRRPWARLAGGLHAPRGARRGARRSGRRDARGRRRGLVPVLDAGRADGQVRLAEALHRVRDLRRDPAQGRDAGLGHDRRDQQGPERADLRLLRHRRRRRPAPDRPEAHGARALARLGDSWPGRSTSLLRSAPATRSARRRIRATSGSRSASRSSAAGPGGLACAIRLGQLLEEHPDVRERLGDVPDRGAREGQAGGLAPPLRRGDEPVAAARALSRTAQDGGLPDVRRGAGRGGLRAHAPLGAPDPAAADDAEPRQPHPLGLRARPFPLRAGRGAGRGRPPRDVGDEAPRRARPRRRRAHGRPGPRARRGAASHVRAGERHRRRADGAGGGDAGVPHRRRHRPVRPPRREPADLGARREGGLARAEAAAQDHPHDGLAAADVGRASASSAAPSSTRWATTS